MCIRSPSSFALNFSAGAHVGFGLARALSSRWALLFDKSHSNQGFLHSSSYRLRLLHRSHLPQWLLPALEVATATLRRSLILANLTPYAPALCPSGSMLSHDAHPTLMHKQPWVDPMLASCVQDCSSVWITGLCILPNISEAAPPFITTRAKTSTTIGKQAHPLLRIQRSF